MHEIELYPNCSLTPRAAALFYSSIVGISFFVAGSFAYLGLWPVLPFAGLEMLAVGAALAASMRRGQYREVILVDGEHVRISKHGGYAKENVAFPRYWTRIQIRRAPYRGHPSRLMIGSRGKYCEVGAFLTEEERHGLGKRLVRILHGDTHGVSRPLEHSKKTGIGVDEQPED